MENLAVKAIYGLIESGLIFGEKMEKPKKIVILTGAGISAESGIPTFRSKEGLWEKYRFEEVATPEAFAVNPALVHDFYNKRRRALLEEVVEPNAAHLALARLEQEYPGSVTIVTQNIDNLHERAGSENVIHMHGELLKIFCGYCGYLNVCEKDVLPTDPCPECSRVGGLRPYVVWFGEMPLEMNRIQSLVMDCDLFVSIGTSGVVYPAAGYVVLAKEFSAETVEINTEDTEISKAFDRSIVGKATVEVPKFVADLLK